MKVVALLFVVVACVAALPAAPRHYADIFKNTLPSSHRIIGGQKASKNQFPYQVSIRWALPALGVPQQHICGGTLIKEDWVLTAAHCKPYNVGVYDVVVGLLQQNVHGSDVQVVQVAEFIVHENYPGGVAPNDIALIRLRQSVKLSDSVQVMPLANEADCDKLDTAVLSGWGYTSTNPVTPVDLMWAELPRISNNECRDSLISLIGEPGPLDGSMICTGSIKTIQQSACSGDSGGPLVLKSSNTLVGVVSWGLQPCGAEGAPSVYTRVCSHTSFINKHVK